MKVLMSETDATEILVRRAREGDQAAFNALIERFQARLESVIASRLGSHLRGRVQADDLRQKVLIWAFKSIDRSAVRVQPTARRSGHSVQSVRCASHDCRRHRPRLAAVGYHPTARKRSATEDTEENRDKSRLTTERPRRATEKGGRKKQRKGKREKNTAAKKRRIRKR